MEAPRTALAVPLANVVANTPDWALKATVVLNAVVLW
jgi:hypothetical protein